MRFNSRTMRYLKDNEAVLIDSVYKVCDVDYPGLQAWVNKIDTYRKRNGKQCKVEHRFGRWVEFPKDMIEKRPQKHTAFIDDFHVSERGEETYTVMVNCLSKESRAKIVQLYHSKK